MLEQCDNSCQTMTREELLLNRIKNYLTTIKANGQEILGYDFTLNINVNNLRKITISDSM